MSEQKDDSIKNYLESKAGKQLKQFLSDGNDLVTREADWNKRAEEIEEAEEKIQKLKTQYGR